MLLGVDVVQKELKLTDDQKAKIQAINDKASAQRTALFAKMPRRNRGNNNNGNNNGGNNNTNNNNAGGTDTVDPQVIFDQVAALQKDTESALAKVLDKTQATRVSQIAVQFAGPGGFRTPMIQQKLNIDEGQQEQINEILDGLSSARRDSMRAVFATLNGGNNNGGNNNGGNNNANTGGRNNGGNNNNGGRPNRPDFNSPEVQAKMAEARTQQTSLNDKAMAAIGKVLKTNQKKAYQTMVGAKFADLDKINPGRRGGPGGPGGNNNTTTTTTTPAAAASAEAAKPAANTAATKPAGRVPLSQRRGAAAPK
jgi:hypothetical protein